MDIKFNKIGFGKHEKHTLAWVLFNDPNYFYWGVRDGVWIEKEHLKLQAEALDYRSRNIKVPDKGNGPSLVYYLAPNKGINALRKVLVLPIPEIPSDEMLSTESFDVRRISDVFDLSYPSELHPDDRHHGPRHLIEAITSCYYGYPTIVWKEKTCQQFFSNDGNFKL